MVDCSLSVEGVNCFDGRLWSQQELHSNRDNHYMSRASLPLTASDTVTQGVDRAHSAYYTSTDTVTSGVDRAHDADVGTLMRSVADEDSVYDRLCRKVFKLVWLCGPHCPWYFFLYILFCVHFARSSNLLGCVALICPIGLCTHALRAPTLSQGLLTS